MRDVLAELRSAAMLGLFPPRRARAVDPVLLVDAHMVARDRYRAHSPMTRSKATVTGLTPRCLRFRGGGLSPSSLISGIGGWRCMAEANFLPSASGKA